MSSTSFCVCSIHLQHHLVSTSYARENDHPRPISFTDKKVKETVVQAKWKNCISLAAFRVGIIGTTCGTDGCLLRYKYQVCQINLKKHADMSCSSIPFNYCRSVLGWKSQKAVTWMPKQEEIFPFECVNMKDACNCVSVYLLNLQRPRQVCSKQKKNNSFGKKKKIKKKKS